MRLWDGTTWTARTGEVPTSGGAIEFTGGASIPTAGNALLHRPPGWQEDVPSPFAKLTFDEAALTLTVRKILGHPGVIRNERKELRAVYAVSSTSQGSQKRGVGFQPLAGTDYYFRTLAAAVIIELLRERGYPVDDTPRLAKIWTWTPHAGH